MKTLTLSLLCAGSAAAVLGFTAVRIFTATSPPAPPVNVLADTAPAAPAPSKPSAPALDRGRISYEGQIITDYRVGQIMGEVKCGKRPVQEAMDYLNVSGVPPVLLTEQTPELTEGFKDATLWCPR